MDKRSKDELQDFRNALAYLAEESNFISVPSVGIHIRKALDSLDEYMQEKRRVKFPLDHDDQIHFDATYEKRN